jgi:phosphoglycerate dehydrogenase-like enzyme
MIQACYTLSPDKLSDIYGPEALARVSRRSRVQGPVFAGSRWREHAGLLRDTEVIFSSWGAPLMDEEFLDTAKNLKAVFYAAGSVRYFTTPAFWSRGIRLTSAYAMNAVPVSEYTVAAALFGLKHVWHYARLTREQRAFMEDRPVVGAYRAKIGLISYGTIARMVRDKLRSFDLQVLVYDPFLSAEDAAREGVRLVSLETLFAESDVVSLHAPSLPATWGLLGAEHFGRMKPFSTFINTARGEIVREKELIEFLRVRPDVQAVLDVTAPEPPSPDNPLFDLPNVMLTPHIAGSLGPECKRMGDAMVDEFERYLEGRPLSWELNEQMVARMA